ncbi:MAG: hydantoinase B/oxoprolinase family protein [bacterium]|nr:hydantoinase B/oxoprolinase family protein [bacterium]
MNPVQFEVIWHRILQIAEEMGIHYLRCSGSQTVVTGNDGATAVMLPDTSLVSIGPYIATQSNVLPLITQSVQRLCGENPGIAPGDVFICNDPYLGAIHHADVAVVAPVFIEDELVSWLGVSGHQLDVGGMEAGGFAIHAVDTHQEGLRIPPVKIVEGGVLRRDIFHWVMNQVRDPLVGLDIKAQLAAIRVGEKALAGLSRRYGLKAVKQVMTESIEYVERRFRARLQELPDGEWREVQFIDHDGHTPEIYRIELTLTKESDRLIFDYTGTSPNARGLINSTYSGLLAGVLCGTYIQLAYDLPWNRGVHNCIEIISEEGTVNNCAYPAPCSMATISAVIVTIDTVFGAIGRMLLASGKLREEAMSLWTGSSMGPIVAGTSQHGHPFVYTEMSHFAGGGGARVDADGVDTGGIVFNTTPNVANIEEIEEDFPLLYLFRRHLTDSGGPGKFRGGLSAELAYIAWRAPEGHLEGSFAGTGGEMPNAIGLSGGLPGAAIRLMGISESGVHDRLEAGKMPPTRLADIPGRHEALPIKHPRRIFGKNEVWYHNWQGAAGYGDPIDRDPRAVLRDLENETVSEEAAEKIYGVIRNAQGIDAEKTAQRKEEIRAERLGRKPPIVLEPETGHAPGFSPPGGAPRLTEDLSLIGNTVCCRKCGTAAGTLDAPLAQAAARNDPPEAAGPVRGEMYARLYKTNRFSLRRHFCPGCATQLEARIVMEGAPEPRWRLKTR